MSPAHHPPLLRSYPGHVLLMADPKRARGQGQQCLCHMLNGPIAKSSHQPIPNPGAVKSWEREPERPMTSLSVEFPSPCLPLFFSAHSYCPQVLTRYHLLWGALPGSCPLLGSPAPLAYLFHSNYWNHLFTSVSLPQTELPWQTLLVASQTAILPFFGP